MVWWLYLTLSAVGGLLLLALLCLLIIRRFAKLEPYGAFIRLSNRRKLTFFRLFLLDQRVPLLVKLLPLFAAAYLASPIDLLPGIPLDDIAFALLALALMVKLTPKDVLEDLLRRRPAQGLYARREGPKLRLQTGPAALGAGLAG